MRRLRKHACLVYGHVSGLGCHTSGPSGQNKCHVMSCLMRRTLAQPRTFPAPSALPQTRTAAAGAPILCHAHATSSSRQYTRGSPISSSSRLTAHSARNSTTTAWPSSAVLDWMTCAQNTVSARAHAHCECLHFIGSQEQGRAHGTWGDGHHHRLAVQRCAGLWIACTNIARTHAHTNTHTHTHAHANKHSHSHAHAHICKQAHTTTSANVHTHTHAQPRKQHMLTRVRDSGMHTAHSRTCVYRDTHVWANVINLRTM